MFVVYIHNLPLSGLREYLCSIFCVYPCVLHCFFNCLFFRLRSYFLDFGFGFGIGIGIRGSALDRDRDRDQDRDSTATCWTGWVAPFFLDFASDLSCGVLLVTGHFVVVSCCPVLASVFPCSLRSSSKLLWFIMSDVLFPPQFCLPLLSLSLHLRTAS